MNPGEIIKKGERKKKRKKKKMEYTCLAEFIVQLSWLYQSLRTLICLLKD